MLTLFPIEPIYPPGFSYHPGFLTIEEEQRLVDMITGIELHTVIFQGFEAKRKVASFGYDYSFDKRAITRGKDIPEEFSFVIQKVAAQLDLNPGQFAELLVTEYKAGTMINWHRDAPPFGLIAGISLLSDCIFKMRPHDKAKQGRGSTISIPLDRRSLYVIDGEARSDWQHSIAPVKATRFSITLRTLKSQTT